MLTNATVKAARPGACAKKIWDEGGLYLHVSPTGTKAWRCRFRWAGREVTISLGHWPELTLDQARDARDGARQQLRRGENPAPPGSAAVDQIETFEAIARAWHAQQRRRWSAEHAGDVLGSLERHVFPAIGARPLAAIAAPDVLELLVAIEDAGRVDEARRVRQRISAVFERAIARSLTSINPAALVAKALAPKPDAVPKAAVLDIARARAVLAAIAAAPGPAVEKLASLLLALTAVRSAAVRGARWTEFAGIDWTGDRADRAPTWCVPSERMKLSVARKGKAAFAHVVPLSWQAVEVLRAARRAAGDSPFVFPRGRGAGGLGLNAIGELYGRAGLRGRHTPHGWRATFATVLNERRPVDRLAIDAALAHMPKDKVEAAYNRSLQLGLRRELFQEWADQLIGADRAPRPDFRLPAPDLETTSA